MINYNQKWRAVVGNGSHFHVFIHINKKLTFLCYYRDTPLFLTYSYLQMNQNTPRKKPLNELKRICQQLKKMPREFTSLDLSGTNFTAINKETRKRLGEFAKLAELTLNDCGIETLGELPLLPQLRSLSLIGNSITDKEIAHLRKYPKLTKLYLSQNEICRLDVFSQLAGLKELRHLQLENNPVYYQEDYHKTAFLRIPQLSSLDGYDTEHSIYVQPEDIDQEQEVVEEDEASGGEDDDEYEEYDDYEGPYKNSSSYPPPKRNLNRRH